MYRHKDRLPQREKMLSEALWATMAGDLEKTIDIYRGIVASWPDDMVARNGVGLYSRSLYRYADAEQAFSPAVEDGSATASMYYNLVTTQIPQGKLVEAQRTLELMRARLPGAAQRMQAAYFLASARYQFDLAMAYADSLTRAGTAGFRYWGHLYRAEVEFMRGHLGAARREIAGVVKAQREQRNPGTALRELVYAQYTLLQSLGDTTAVRSAVEAALAEIPFDSLPVASRPYGEVARTWIALGRPDEARKIMAQFDRDVPELLRNDDQPMDRARAALAIAEKRYADAIPLARKGSRGCDGCTGELVASAFEGLGQIDSAIVALEKAIALPLYGSGYQNWRAAVVPRAMFHLGMLYEQRGQRQLARDRYASFIDMWETADPQLQSAVAAARDRLRALSGER
jgi:tetratricopeptide (TPR) repeat protein